MPDPDLPHEPWLEPWFHHPTRAELTSGHHLRPLRAADDGLPGLPAGLDVVAAAAATAARTAFVYGLFDDEERRLLGWVSLDRGIPPYDVVAGWSVAPADPDSALGAELAAMLPDWLTRSWPWTAAQVAPL